MRGPVWIAILWLWGLNAWGDELAVTPLVPIEVPSLGTNSSFVFINPGVAAFGTNAIFFWEQRGGNLPGSPTPFYSLGTNFFMSRLGMDGSPIDNPGRLVFAIPHGDDVPRVAGMNSGYYAVFDRATDSFTIRTPTNYFTRFTFDGRAQFEPFVIGTNFSSYRIATNGRTLLYVQRDQPNPTNSRADSLRYRLMGPDGTTISSDLVKGSPQPAYAYIPSELTYAVASDGKDYLLLPGARANAIRVDGETGAYTKLASTNFPGYFGGISYGKNGYLLVDGLGFLQVLPDGSEVARASMPFYDVNPSVAFAEGEGWVVFAKRASVLISYRVTPNDGGLVVERDPYPPVSITSQDQLEGMFAPFGEGRYLVTTHLGLSILEKNGLAQVETPKNYLRQENSAVVASPFGCLVVWSESDGVQSSIHGLRIAKDGTRIDGHSFVIQSGYSEMAPSCTFDGNDFAIGWSDADFGEARIARISPQGEPNVRLRTLSLPFGVAPSVVGFQGKLFVYQSEHLWSAPDMHIWQVFEDGEISAETLVHGESLVTDGKDLYAIADLQGGDIARIRVDPGAAQPETSITIIASGGGSQGFSLQRGFVVRWTDALGHFFYSYFLDGKEWLHSNAPLLTIPQFAASADRLMVVSPVQYRSSRYSFQTFNLLNGEVASEEVDLGWVGALQLASAGKDFLAVTDSASPWMHYVGSFWAIPASLPSFAPVLTVGGGLKANLTLNRNRRYRIEMSDDLVNWNLVEVVSGEAEHEVANSGNEKEFLRAVLVPE